MTGGGILAAGVEQLERMLAMWNDGRGTGSPFTHCAIAQLAYSCYMRSIVSGEFAKWSTAHTCAHVIPPEFHARMRTRFRHDVSGENHWGGGGVSVGV